jgi:hypothetical protein
MSVSKFTNKIVKASAYLQTPRLARYCNVLGVPNWLSRWWHWAQFVHLCTFISHRKQYDGEKWLEAHGKKSRLEDTAKDRDGRIDIRFNASWESRLFRRDWYYVVRLQVCWGQQPTCTIYTYMGACVRCVVCKEAERVINTVTTMVLRPQ